MHNMVDLKIIHLKITFFWRSEGIPLWGVQELKWMDVVQKLPVYRHPYPILEKVRVLFVCKHTYSIWIFSLYSPAWEENWQFVDWGFTLHGEAVVFVYSMDIALTTLDDFPKMC